MLVFLLLTTFLVNKASAQACMTGAGAGPCLNNMCTPGFTCIQDINECCPDASLITTVATLAPACVDKVNPTTGVSDCAARASLCNDATYYAVMTDQCPRTCGRCSGSTTNTTANSTCVDLINPTTGVSDCPQRVALCTDSNYSTLMRTGVVLIDCLPGGDYSSRCEQLDRNDFCFLRFTQMGNVCTGANYAGMDKELVHHQEQVSRTIEKELDEDRKKKALKLLLLGFNESEKRQRRYVVNLNLIAGMVEVINAVSATAKSFQNPASEDAHLSLQAPFIRRTTLGYLMLPDESNIWGAVATSPETWM
ncbi:shTK domain protein [Teladorsagia circumcincta]|uniref:ShTK domain protein n=1 Tax=Teladorsagia circumcincta TaxID=45464 RepID=A0A2G9U9N8_TELCI|nr:shTK domain protein [Teladorsagia circumcincta]